MLKFGMPTLLEMAEIAECAGLCRELGFEFIEMNMNLPQYQVQTMDVTRLQKAAKEYGIGYTIHLDENMNVADFNPDVAAAYRNCVIQTIELAKKLEIPVLNMHLIQGVYFTLPHVKVYLYDKFRDYYRDTCVITKADIIAFLKANCTYKIKAGLAETTAKVKIVTGSREQNNILNSAKLIYQAIPGSQLEILPGLRHGDLSINHPERYVQMLKEWREHND